MNKPQSERGTFEKVGVCLYRLSSNGQYYARVWSAGKEIRRSLRTNDRKLAKRRLRDPPQGYEAPRHHSSQMKLSELIEHGWEPGFGPNGRPYHFCHPRELLGLEIRK